MAEQYRVVVIEDDLDVALYTRKVLEKRIGARVITVSDPRRVSEAMTALSPDVVITDIEMPGASGLDLIADIRVQQPGTPVIVMTAHASVDYAISALRNSANEFLTKPVSSAGLAATVARLADAFRAEQADAHEPQVVLAIGARPDDVESGVGGILAAHRAAGDIVTVLTLSRGDRDGGIRTAWDEGSAAAGTIGARLVLEDAANAGALSLDAAVSAIRRVVSDIGPTVVYAPSRNDGHPDSKVAHEAAVIASDRARTVACYQGSSATVDFRPNRFVSIDGHTDAKLAMLACFASQGNRPKHLAPDFALATARYWSRYGHGTSCEPLEILRESAQVG
jgi:LmbE family N-acetylglucosaminyl deacetylase/CheY-like chemotaxis protein